MASDLEAARVTAPELYAENVRKTFPVKGLELPVLADISFEQPRGQFLVVVGPSGCGKTTLLRLAAGLLRPDGGRILHREEEVDAPPNWVALVLQEYNRTLFPWLSVRRNVGFGIKDTDRKGRDQRVTAALDAVGLASFDHFYPWQLSGGMQQRTALARALASSARLLLLDEPFASIDAQTRMELQDLVMRLKEELQMSVLMVTHDIEEAILMGDRILVLSSRPARVLADVLVPLPRPRDQLTTKESSIFLSLRHEIFSLLRTGPTADGREEGDVHGLTG